VIRQTRTSHSRPETSGTMLDSLEGYGHAGILQKSEENAE
jgi:hypothetical protein